MNERRLHPFTVLRFLRKTLVVYLLPLVQVLFERNWTALHTALRQDALLFLLLCAVSWGILRVSSWSLDDNGAFHLHWRLGIRLDRVLRGEMLAGLGEFWRRYGEKLTVAQFEARMRKHLPMEMYQEARRRTQGKTTPATAFNKTIRFTMCAVFVKAYNKQLRTNSPNRLELEWDHEDEE